MKYAIPFLLIFLSIFGEEKSDSDIDQVSEAFGHLIYRNFTCLNVKFDLGKILQGIENAAAGKAPIITEKECIDAIHREQDKNFKCFSQENLKQANEFLQVNALKDGVICLAGGKVQYRRVIAGFGAEVRPSTSPVVRMSVKQSDGTDIWEPNLVEAVNLDHAIEGLQYGLVGMKEGEKRILYIHPDFAYGEKGFFVSLPNALLIFEVEVLKIKAD